MRISTEFAEIVGRAAWEVHGNQRSTTDGLYWCYLFERAGWINVEDDDGDDVVDDDGDPVSHDPDCAEDFQLFGRLIINQLQAAKAGYAEFAALSVEQTQCMIPKGKHRKRFERIIAPLQYGLLPQRLTKWIPPKTKSTTSAPDNANL